MVVIMKKSHFQSTNNIWIVLFFIIGFFFIGLYIFINIVDDSNVLIFLLALSLLFNECVRYIYINDKDISIYAFWHSILHESEAFCKLIRDTPIDIEIWHKQKEIQSNKDNVDLLSLGFSTFFLNRTNRSGILKAGVIGGYNQTGKYKIDARFNKEDLISDISYVTIEVQAKNAAGNWVQESTGICKIEEE